MCAGKGDKAVSTERNTERYAFSYRGDLMQLTLNAQTERIKVCMQRQDNRSSHKVSRSAHQDRSYHS